MEQARKAVPSDTGTYGKRVGDLRVRMDDLQAKLSEASERQISTQSAQRSK